MVPAVVTPKVCSKTQIIPTNFRSRRGVDVIAATICIAELLAFQQFGDEFRRLLRDRRASVMREQVRPIWKWSREREVDAGRSMDVGLSCV